MTTYFRNNAPVPFLDRNRGEISDLLEAAKTAEFDPNEIFRKEHGHSPLDLLKVAAMTRRGFENIIKAESISPPMNDPVFLAFTSAKFVPGVGEYFSFSDTKVSFINPETFAAQNFRAKRISEEQYTAVSKQDCH
jgi:hypothetical protein